MSELNTGAEDVGGLRLGPDLEDEFERDEEARTTGLVHQPQDALEKQQQDSGDAARKLDRDDEEDDEGRHPEARSESSRRERKPSPLPMTTPSIPPPTPPRQASPTHTLVASPRPSARITPAPRDPTRDPTAQEPDAPGEHDALGEPSGVANMDSVCEACARANKPCVPQTE